MTKDAQFLTCIRKTSSVVNITDGSHEAAQEVGEGYLWCETQSGTHQVELKDVLYVPRLEDNLL